MTKRNELFKFYANIFSVLVVQRLSPWQIVDCVLRIDLIRLEVSYFILTLSTHFSLLGRGFVQFTFVFHAHLIALFSLSEYRVSSVWHINLTLQTVTMFSLTVRCLPLHNER